MNGPTDRDDRVPAERTLRWGFSAVFIVLGILLLAPPECFPAQQVMGEDFSLLDGSWQLELPSRWLRSEIAGRDFVFTYGPLYQILHAPPGASPDDVASLLRFRSLPEAVVVALC